MMKSPLLILCILLTAASVSAQYWHIVSTDVTLREHAYADNAGFPPCAMPTPTEDNMVKHAYIPGWLGKDYRVEYRALADENAVNLCGGDSRANTTSYAYSFVDGEGTNMITIEYATNVHNQAGQDVSYECRGTSYLDFEIVLQIDGPFAGEPVLVYYLWDQFALLLGEHENIDEDTCHTSASLNVDTDGDVLHNYFDYPRLGVIWGLNDKKNQPGLFARAVGDQLIISGTLEAYAATNVPTNFAGTYDDQLAAQWGRIRLSIDNPINPLGRNSLEDAWLEFSVDIGSDCEMSDPVPNGNEYFDPGDSYHWRSTIYSGGQDGIEDDAYIFGIGDPPPIAPDGPPPTTGAPVSSGLSIYDVVDDYFDLDGEDHTDFDLRNMTYGRGHPPINHFDSECVFTADNLFISYDDDRNIPYTDPSGSPLTSSSELLYTIYGDTTRKDEVVGLKLYTAALPPQFVFAYPFLDEDSTHINLTPAPLPFINRDDDDVDALDIRDEACTYYYFSPDHEAKFGLDPGFIYQLYPGGGTFAVISDTANLGLPEDVDVDAFEFVWLPEETATGLDYHLGLLFSVDDDDPSTLEDESGGLDPAMLYASYLNGAFFNFLELPMIEDVDAIAAWETPLYPDESGYVPPCDPVDDLVIAVDGTTGDVILSFEAPQNATYTIYQTNVPNASYPPDPTSPEWNSMFDVYLDAGDVYEYTITGSDLTDFGAFAVVATCP